MIPNDLNNSLIKNQKNLDNDISPTDENSWIKHVSSRKSQQITSEELSEILRKHSFYKKNNSKLNNDGKNRNSVVVNRGNIKSLFIPENNNLEQSLNSEKIKNNNKNESSDSLSESSSLTSNSESNSLLESQKKNKKKNNKNKVNDFKKDISSKENNDGKTGNILNSKKINDLNNISDNINNNDNLNDNNKNKLKDSKINDFKSDFENNDNNKENNNDIENKIKKKNNINQNFDNEKNKENNNDIENKSKKNNIINHNFDNENNNYNNDIENTIKKNNNINHNENNNNNNDGIMNKLKNSTNKNSIKNFNNNDNDEDENNRNNNNMNNIKNTLNSKNEKFKKGNNNNSGNEIENNNIENNNIENINKNDNNGNNNNLKKSQNINSLNPNNKNDNKFKESFNDSNNLLKNEKELQKTLKNNNNKINSLKKGLFNNKYPTNTYIKDNISEEVNIKSFKQKLKDKKGQKIKYDEYGNKILSTEDKFQMLRHTYLKIPNFNLSQNNNNNEEEEINNKEKTNNENNNNSNKTKEIITPMENINNPELELLTYNQENKSLNPFSRNSAFMSNKHYLNSVNYNKDYNSNNENYDSLNDNNDKENNNEGNKSHRNPSSFKYLEEITKSPSENNIFVQQYGNTAFNSIENNKSVSPFKKKKDDFYDNYDEKNNNINKKFNTIDNEKEIKNYKLHKKRNNKSQSINSNLIMPIYNEKINYESSIMNIDDTQGLRKIINNSRNNFLKSKIPSLKDSFRTSNKDFSPKENAFIYNNNSGFKSAMRDIHYFENNNVQRKDFSPEKSNRFEDIKNGNQKVILSYSNKKKYFSPSNQYYSRNQNNKNLYQVYSGDNNTYFKNMFNSNDKIDLYSFNQNINESKNINEQKVNKKNKINGKFFNSFSSSKLDSSNKNNHRETKENINKLKTLFKNNNYKFQINKDNIINSIKKDTLFYKFADSKLKKQLLPPNAVNSDNINIFK